MPEDLERLAELQYQKIRGNLETQVQEEENKFLGKGVGGPASISKIITLHIEKITKLCEERFEIEKNLLLQKYGKLEKVHILGIKNKINKIISIETDMLEKREYMGEYYPWIPDKIKESKDNLELHFHREMEILELQTRLESKKHTKEEGSRSANPLKNEITLADAATIFEAKPGIFGFSIDLIKSAKLAVKAFKRLFRRNAV